MLDYSQLLVIDVKSTIWEKPSDKGKDEKEEIIAIDVALIDTIKQEIIEREDMLVKPVKSRISDYCFSHYGISHKQLMADGMSFEEAYRRVLVHFMSKDRLWCIWGSATQYLLSSSCRSRNLDGLFNYPALDVSHVFSMFSGSTSDGMGPGIEDAYEHCGLKLNEINSAVAIAKLILKMGQGIRAPKITQPNNNRNFFTRNN